MREGGFHVEIQRAAGGGIFRITGLVHRSVRGIGSRLWCGGRKGRPDGVKDRFRG
jgi:hypothetical protein